MVWKSKTGIYSKVPSINCLKEEAFLQKYQHKTLTVYNDKTLKKSCLKSDYNALDKETQLLLSQHFNIVTRIMTDNILPEHIRILETLYNF